MNLNYWQYCCFPKLYIIYLHYNLLFVPNSHFILYIIIQILTKCPLIIFKIIFLIIYFIALWVTNNAMSVLCLMERKIFALMQPNKCKNQRRKPWMRNKAKLSLIIINNINPKLINKSHSPLECCIKGNGLAHLSMDMGFKHGQMEQSTKANGMKVKLMAKVNLLMLMEIYMRGNGKTIRLTAMAFIYIVMGLDTKVTGKMICNLEMGIKTGLMAVGTKDYIKMEKSMDMANTNGLTEVHIKEVG